MNLDLARQILGAAAEHSDGCIKLRGRELLHEATLMQEEGWLQLTKLPEDQATVLARLTETGQRVCRLFQDDAIAQRLRNAFLPRVSSPLV